MTGVRDLMFDILDWDQGKFSLKMVVKNKRDGFIWELINVYGPAHQSNRGFWMNFPKECSRGCIL